MCGSPRFGRFLAHHQELKTALAASGSSVVGRGLAGNLPDHDQQRCYRHAPTVKPEVANAVVISWRWARKRPKHVEPHINVK